MTLNPPAKKNNYDQIDGTVPHVLFQGHSKGKGQVAEVALQQPRLLSGTFFFLVSLLATSIQVLTTSKF